MGGDVDGRSWCARTDVEQYTGEDVTVLGEQSREDAPQKPDCLLSRAKPSAGNGSGGTCSNRRCARSTGDGNVEKQKREEERYIRVLERGEDTR
jgi:hypothetical protein